MRSPKYPSSTRRSLSSALAQDQVDGGRQRGLERRAETVGERAQLAHLGPDHDDLVRLAEGGEEACDTQLVQAELASRGLEIARDESMHGPRASAGSHGVYDHRLGTAFEVRKRVQARGAGVDRRHAALQAPEHVVPEAVVAVPGVAEADGSHENVNAPCGTPLAVARCTVQTRHASCERTTWNSSTG